MKAKVTKAFPGRPDKEAQTRRIEVGETITGDLASVAVGQGWAENCEAKPKKSAAQPKGTDIDQKAD